LELSLSHSGWAQPKTLDDFIPDHGYPMHLYLVRSPKLDAIYHLHPELAKPGLFRLQMPDLEPGHYRIFADVVHRSGFPETLSAEIEIPAHLAHPALPSADDAGGVFPEFGTSKSYFQTKSKLRVELVKGELRAGKPLSLHL